MANLNLSKIFEKDLSQMDRDVYEHLQQKVELFASLKKQIDEICKVAHSKFELQDYLQVAYMTYELKQLNSKSFVVLEHVNPNTVFFYTLDEKLDYLLEHDYLEEEFLNKYDREFVKSLMQEIYKKKFRFRSFMSAFKFYKQYAF